MAGDDLMDEVHTAITQFDCIFIDDSHNMATSRTLFRGV